MENVAKPLGVTLDEALLNMEQAYVGKIAEAMKKIAPDLKDAALLAFGGAGPMSACRVADALGVKEIIVPRMAAVFSAFGIGFSDIAHSYDAALNETSDEGMPEILDRLTERATRDMFAEGFDLSECTVEKTLSFSQNGEQATRRLNGDKKLPAGLQSARDLRVQLRATKAIPHFALKQNETRGGAAAATSLSRKVRQSDGGQLTDAALPLYRHEDLLPGQGAAGPAVVEEEYFTCLVPKGWKFTVNDNHDVVLQKS
jgi:N-methylhydantoinase A/oxoprolinase/acetone carboxylase beta subunit